MVRRAHASLLGTAEEVPEYQRRPYICCYYRLERPCLRHFCSLHNELGNMWTHIVAHAYTFYRLLRWLSSEDLALLSLGFPRALYAIGVLAYFTAALAVFSASVQFHWRMCTPKREFLCWRCLDQSMCLAVVTVGFFAGIPMGFHCYPFWQMAYLAQSVLVCVGMAAVGLVGGENAGLLTTGLIFGSLTALVPAAHWLTTSGAGWSSAGPRFVQSILLGLLAALVFTSHFPECLAPGRYDLLGSSHQIWHVLIFCCIVFYGDCLTAVFELTGSPEYCA